MGRILDSNTAWLASARETTFKTAVARTKSFGWNREQFPEIEAPQVTDIDQYTGFDEPTTSQIPGINFPFSLAVDRAKPDDIAFAAAMAMGSITSAVAFTGATVAKRHQIIRQTAPLLPSCTWERKQGTTLGEIYAGSVCERLALSYENTRQRFLSLECDWIGSGYTRSTSPTALPALLNERFIEYLKGNAFVGSYSNDTPATDLDLSTTAAVVDFTIPGTKGGSLHPTLTAFNWEFNNNIDREQIFRTGEGLYPYQINRGQSTQTLSATFIKDDAYNFVSTVAANTDLSLEIMVQGPQTENISAEFAYEGIRLQFPRVTMSNPRDTSVNNELRTTVDLTIKRKSAAVEATYLQLFNKVATYA